MPQTITNAFVQQFDATIRMLSQQKESRLEATVFDRGSVTGESFTANLLAPIEDTPENNIRHGDTVWSDTVHSTRVALMQDFYQALPVDRNDLPKLMANPTGSYSDALVAAWNRRKDRIIWAALTGNSQLKNGTTVAMPAGQKIAAASAGFTKAKLIFTRKLFRKNEADNHNGEEMYIAYTSDMLEDVMSDTTLTSADHLAVKMLQDGDLASKWMGFNWVPYESITKVGNTFTTAAWTKSSVHRGTGYTEGKASPRPDKKDLTQVSMAGSYGATRVDENRVVLIDFE